MMLFDTFQEKCDSCIKRYKAAKNPEEKALAHIALEETKVEYYTGLLADKSHTIYKLTKILEEQLENSYLLLGNARDEYYDATGKEYGA